MGRDVKRSYHAPLRKEQADRTRSQVMLAAAQVFAAKGYSNTRMEDIAQVAGVAVPTVYKTFGTKSALLRETVNSVMAETYSGARVEEQHWWQEQITAQDARTQLSLIARNARMIYERAGPLLEVVRVAAAGDEDVKAVWQLINIERRGRSELTAESLMTKGALRPGMTGSLAATTLHLVSAPELYVDFLDKDGATPQDYEKWLAEVFSNALLQ